MTTAVASRASLPLGPAHLDRDPSPKSYPTLAPSTAAVSSSRMPAERHRTAANSESPKETSVQKTPDSNKPSPTSSRSGGGGAPPKIVVKKEPPSSPTLQPNVRHRPRKLDLSTNVSAHGGRPSAGPFTARDGTLGLQDVGIACLSPGFQTQDPAMREQLQKSLAMKEQQKHIIESRLQSKVKGDGSDSTRTPEASSFAGPRSSKKGPPPGLSIVPPSAERFANERVIQSAPLNQTFTGRHAPPLTRHLTSNAQPIQHVPATQTSNRLPPIQDVFGSDTLAPRDSNSRNGYYSNSNSSHSNNRPPFPSPGLPPHTAQPSTRPREYRSAEEAVHEMAGGREELLPRIVHYGGNGNGNSTSNGHHQHQQQPPTPPSPHPNAQGRSHNPVTPNKSSHHAVPQYATYPPSHQDHYPQQHQQQQSQPQNLNSSRRRGRSEYENEHGSPPLGPGPDSRRHASQHGPFGAGRDSPETIRRKKEEFLGLCARAWDLFHY